jgi:type II secretory pathway predicted ATPase ExeA
VTPAELAAWVERSRREQGYPAHVEDVGVLAAVAAIVNDGDQVEETRVEETRVEEGGGDAAA